jgi:glycosyltransferase involved in cell wall biosynthesis
MERDVIAAAARVVFVNRYTRDRVMGKYAADWMKKTHVVPQGHVGVSSSRERNRSGAPMRIVYTGRFYDGIRTPETFLRAMASVHKDSPLDRRVVVEFVGSRMEPYQQLAVTLGIDALVRFSGRVSPDQARARAAAADVLLMIDAHSDGDSLFLPSKLIDYLPLGAPILAVTPAVGPSADLVRELGYRVVDPGDVHGIANAIKQLLASYEASSLTPSARHESVAEAYHIRATTMAFEAVLDAAVGTP